MLNFNFFLKPGLLLVGLSLLLGGCQSLQQTSLNRYGPAQLSQQQHWFIKARVAIQSPEENISATLEWRNTGKDFNFHLYGLLGATYAHLLQENGQATLQLPDDQTYYHQDSSELLSQTLGWEFPMEALSSWIKGLPSGKAGEKITRDKDGQIESIALRDWQVEFSAFERYSGYLMPRKITASHPQLRLKILVKRWDFFQPGLG